MLALEDKQDDKSYVFLPEDVAEILLLQLLSWWRVDHDSRTASTNRYGEQG
jgi:hypothetical protein